MKNQPKDLPDVAIYRGVYALGICVVPDNVVATLRTSLDAMHGMDYAMVPYSLAKSMYDTLELHIIRKLPYLAGMGASGKLIILEKGSLRLTPLGETAMKKLSNNLHKRG